MHNNDRGWLVVAMAEAVFYLAALAFMLMKVVRR